MQTTVLAQHASARGEVLVRIRAEPDGPVEELIVNGVFAMDSRDTSTERRLAEFGLRSGTGSRRVLLGGLGLGYTAAALLEHDVDAVDVVEIEVCLVSWARDGLTPTLRAVAADPRVRLHVADVRSVLTEQRSGPRGPWDVILLDVDNGPDFLIHGSNDALYTRASLGAAYERLAPGGTLAIWCQDTTPALLAVLEAIGTTAQEHRYRVQRGQRSWSYAIYTLTRPI